MLIGVLKNVPADRFDTPYTESDRGFINYLLMEVLKTMSSSVKQK
jgi:hypothetical protein